MGRGGTRNFAASLQEVADAFAPKVACSTPLPCAATRPAPYIHCKLADPPSISAEHRHQRRVHLHAILVITLLLILILVVVFVYPIAVTAAIIIIAQHCHPRHPSATALLFLVIEILQPQAI